VIGIPVKHRIWLIGELPHCCARTNFGPIESLPKSPEVMRSRISSLIRFQGSFRLALISVVDVDIGAQHGGKKRGTGTALRRWPMGTESAAVSERASPVPVDCRSLEPSVGRMSPVVRNRNRCAVVSGPTAER